MKKQISIFQVVLVILMFCFSVPADAGIGKSQTHTSKTIQANSSNSKIKKAKGYKHPKKSGTKATRDRRGIFSMIFGIKAAIMLKSAIISSTFFLWPLTLGIGIFGMILGLKSMRRARANGEKPSRSSKIGLILSSAVVGTIAVIATTLAGIVSVAVGF